MFRACTSVYHLLLLRRSPVSVFSETLNFSGGGTARSESPCGPVLPVPPDGLVGGLVSGAGRCTLQIPGSGNLQPVGIPMRRPSLMPERPSTVILVGQAGRSKQWSSYSLQTSSRMLWDRAQFARLGSCTSSPSHPLLNLQRRL